MMRHILDIDSESYFGEHATISLLLSVFKPLDSGDAGGWKKICFMAGYIFYELFKKKCIVKRFFT